MPRGGKPNLPNSYSGIWLTLSFSILSEGILLSTPVKQLDSSLVPSTADVLCLFITRDTCLRVWTSCHQGIATVNTCAYNPSSPLLNLLSHSTLRSERSNDRCYYSKRITSLSIGLTYVKLKWVAVISAKNHKRQSRKRQSVTAKREKSQTPQVLTAILTLPNLT